MKLKTVTIIKKEKSKNVPYMTHYTLIYRGRPYIETLQGIDRDRYDVGDKVEVQTYRNTKQQLCFVLRRVVGYTSID